MYSIGQYNICLDNKDSFWGNTDAICNLNLETSRFVMTPSVIKTKQQAALLLRSYSSVFILSFELCHWNCEVEVDRLHPMETGAGMREAPFLWSFLGDDNCLVLIDLSSFPSDITQADVKSA